MFLKVHTVITRKLWNGRTTLQQYLSEFDVVTKNIVLLDTYQITKKINGSVCTVYFLNLKPDSKSRLPISEFSGYHCSFASSIENQLLRPTYTAQLRFLILCELFKLKHLSYLSSSYSTVLLILP